MKPLASVFITALLLFGCGRARHMQPRRLVPAATPGAALPPFLSDVSAVKYEYIFLPDALPTDVFKAFQADNARPQPFRIAAPGQAFNSGCLVDSTLPDIRLVNAALSAKYAVVHFEYGGFAPGSRVIVFGRTPSASAVALWRQDTYFRFTSIPAFAAALKDGSLWKATPEEHDQGAGA